MAESINPRHYDRASDLGRRVLKCFGFTEYLLNMRCCNALEILGWHQDAYLYLAAKHLWRLGEKNELAIEIGKARWYLNRWLTLDAPRNAATIESVEQAIAELNRLEAEIN